MRLIWGLLALALLAACTPSYPSPQPALIPSPPASVTAEDSRDSFVPPPAPTVPPLFTDQTPPARFDFPSPTATAWVPAVALPAEALYISLPGPQSQVRSRFLVQGFGGPSAEGRLLLRLLGDEGQLLAEREARLFSRPGKAGRFGVYLEFAIDVVAMPARLEVSIFDPGDGGVAHLASTELLLLSHGSPGVHYTFHPAERLTILTPASASEVEGGAVQVSGAGWASSNRPLQVQVLDQQGKIVGAGEALLEQPAVGLLGTFSSEIAYQVSRAQPGRIVVYEQDDHGLIHLTSLQVHLKP